MIIQYIKKTGQIIASYPDIFCEPPDIKIHENGKMVISKKDVDYFALDPLDARRYLDPKLRDKFNIHKRKVIFDKGKIKHLVAPDGRIIKVWHKKNIDEYFDLWGEFYKALKGLYPGVKIMDAAKKEGIIK